MNVKKTTYLIFKPWQKKCNHNFSISLGDQLLTQTNSTKFLGVYIDEHLTWKDHISYLCKQISKSIGMLFRSIEEQRHGLSYWKFNASLLDDHDFVRLITESVPIWREEFKEVNDKRVLWDLIKYRIRQVTIKFGKEKASAKREKLKILEDSLKVCEDECGKDPSPKVGNT